MEWWHYLLMLVAVAAVVYYMKSGFKPKSTGCSACPNKENNSS